MALVRRLTDEGRAAFRDWIAAGAVGEPPRGLLEDFATSQALTTSAQVDDVKFATRLECGRHICDRLQNLPKAELSRDRGVWDWLSLFYIDQLMPVTDGKRALKEAVRYCLQFENRKWSRHLLRMNWLSVVEHGVHARLLLTRPMHEHGDMLEQIGSQQALFGSKSMVAVADRLYWDETRGAPRRGAATRSKPGVVQRLPKIMHQFELTYDVEGLASAQILALLPQEFDGWRPAAGAQAAIAAEVGLQPSI